VNIVNMALQYLAPALVSKLASGLGINQAIANTVIKAAVPVILGALVGKSSKPDGARDLLDVLVKQDTGLLGRLSTVLGSPQQKTIAEQGAGVLGSLLGNSTLGALVGAVAKFSGANESAVSGVVGMLSPIVLGTLSQQQKSASLDVTGITKLLADQKPNITAAIPGELSKLLSGTGLLDGLTQKAETAAKPATSAAAASPARSTPAAAPVATVAPPAPARPFNGWPWAILVGAASLLWGTWFGGAPTPWASVPAPPRLMAGSTDVAGELDSALKSLHGLMSTVKDKGSAEAAVPELRRAEAAFTRLDTAARQLPADGKRILAGHVASWMPVITPLMTSALANTTVGPVVKPMLEAVRGRLDALVKG
jgi:hypothetical protein